MDGFIQAMVASHLFMSIGHAVPGAISTESPMFQEPNESHTVWTRTSEENEPYCLSNLVLTNELLMVFYGCHTAVNATKCHGSVSIAGEAVCRCAQCAIGFDGEVWCGNPTGSTFVRQYEWASAFWEALSQGLNEDGLPDGHPDTVLDAAVAARDRMEHVFGENQFWGTHQYHLFGNQALVIVPAR